MGSIRSASLTFVKVVNPNAWAIGNIDLYCAYSFFVRISIFLYAPLKSSGLVVLLLSRAFFFCPDNIPNAAIMITAAIGNSHFSIDVTTLFTLVGFYAFHSIVLACIQFDPLCFFFLYLRQPLFFRIVQGIV